MAHRGRYHHPELFAVADPAIVFPPIHLRRVGSQVLAADPVMNTGLGTAQAGEEALGQVRAALAVAIGQGVIDPLRIKSTV